MTNDAADEAAHKAANEAANQAANGATTEAANRAANKAVNETATAEASEATIEASNEAAKHGGQPSSEPGSQRGNGEGVFAGHPFFGCPLSRRVASGPDFCRSRRAYQARPHGPVPPARAARRPPRPTMPGAPLSADEIRLAQVWYTNNMAPSTIAENLHRDKSTITRLIKDNFQKETAGRKNMLSDAQVDNLISHLERLIKKANGEYEVTWHMLKTSSRCKASEATIARRLHEKGYRFYGMRHKPLLTDQDIQDRFEFGETYQGKPASWWQSHVHMHIDVKFFPVLLTGKARRHVAQSGTRGVIRRPGEGLNAGYVKPNPKLKYNTGAKGVHILAGVGNGKVLLWEEVQGNWNSSEAARIYEGPMLKALKAAYPGTAIPGPGGQRPVRLQGEQGRGCQGARRHPRLRDPCPQPAAERLRLLVVARGQQAHARAGAHVSLWQARDSRRLHPAPQAHGHEHPLGRHHQEHREHEEALPAPGPGRGWPDRGLSPARAGAPVFPAGHLAAAVPRELARHLRATG